MAKLFLPKDSDPPQVWRKWREKIASLLNQDDVIPLSSLPDSVQNASSGNAAAAGRLFMAADGESVSFGGTYGVAPKRIEAKIDVLPFLPAGQKYDCRALNITATGFDAYAKITTPTGYTSNTSGAGSYDSGLGYWTADKPVTDDAYNNIYTFNCNIVLPPTGGSYDPYSSYEMTWYGEFEIYAKVSGSWVLVSTEIVSITDFTTGYPTARTENNYLFYIPITQVIGMVAGAEFGIKAKGSAAITAFNEVTYETETTGAPVSVGTQKLQWFVYA